MSFLELTSRFKNSRLLIGLGLALLLAGVIGAGVLLLTGDDEACTPRFCAEVIGPSGEDVDPMTPVRIRLNGVDETTALAAIQISNEPKGSKRFEDGVLTFRPEWP